MRRQVFRCAVAPALSVGKRFLTPAEPYTPRGKTMSSDELNRNTLIEDARVISVNATYNNPTENYTWDTADVKNVRITHKKPRGIVDNLAYGTTKLIRFAFDILSGYKFGPVTDNKALRRICFLETIAGVPGMVAGSIRHLSSLRRMRRDHGWIHTLLEEAENERMHLLTFIQLYNPGYAFRFLVKVTQVILYNVLCLAYLVSPRYCHRLVGYIEEEAIRTYTHIIELIEEGKLFQNAECPKIAISYWKLADNAKMLDLMIAVRADEAGHKLVNHTFADMHAEGLQNSTNPFLVKPHPK